MEGPPDHLFLCHGLVDEKMLIDTNLLQWDKIINLNLRASFHLISLTVAFMKFSKNHPSITVLSGSAGNTPVPGACAFSVSMAMLNMLVKNTALEVGHIGIRVNAVAPGVTNTKGRESKEGNFFFQLSDSQRLDDNLARKIVQDQNGKFLKEADGMIPLFQGQTPQGVEIPRLNEASDVAKTMLWLGSEDASFVTGEILVMDGG